MQDFGGTRLSQGSRGGIVSGGGHWRILQGSIGGSVTGGGHGWILPGSIGGRVTTGGMVIGGIQLMFEFAGHFAGAGPFGDVFDESPYTIGFAEAHGLAFLIGALLLTVARKDLRRFWHAFAAAVHVLLGGANIVFWASFSAFGMVPMGVAATIAHALFVVLQLAALRTKSETTARA